MQDTGCIPGVRVFRYPGSAFGARYPALGVDPVPGPGSPGAGYPGPGTRYLAPVFEKPAHGVWCRI